MSMSMVTGMGMTTSTAMNMTTSTAMSMHTCMTIRMHTHMRTVTGITMPRPGHIGALIDGLNLPDEVKCHAKTVYDSIAQAEAHAHGCPLGDVHFHEVGALDAVADVTGVCYAMYLLKVQRIIASPVHVGSGTVRCAHGVMPGAGAGYGISPTGSSKLWRRGKGRAVYAHRGGAACSFCGRLWTYADDEE